VIATLGAFAYAQRVKRDPLVVDRVSFGTEGQHQAFTPNGDCKNDAIRIRFRTTVSDHANVQIVKPGGKLVITLAREAFLKRYHFHTYYWNGAERGGGEAPQGRYKVRVTLLGEDRVLVLPGTIHLHRVPPETGRQNGTVTCSTAIPEDQGAGLGRSS
jgi:hypothetical protein